MSAALKIPEWQRRPCGLAWPERLVRCDAVVIGVGAVGRQVALQLASLRLRRLTLYDDDRIRPDNLVAEGYWPEDLHRTKVSATANLCRRIQPLLLVTEIAERFDQRTHGPARLGAPVVFCCVDRIRARREIWASVRRSALFFVDGRRSAKELRAIAVDNPAVDKDYPSTLFACAQQVDLDSAGLALYTASLVAGLMVHQFAQWLWGLAVDAELSLTLHAAEFTARKKP